MPIHYHIVIRAYLDDRWSAWFDGLTITNLADGRAILAGPIVDQAALYGVLMKLRDLGLALVAVQPAAEPTPDQSGAAEMYGRFSDHGR